MGAIPQSHLVPQSVLRDIRWCKFIEKPLHCWTVVAMRSAALTLDEPDPSNLCSSIRGLCRTAVAAAVKTASESCGIEPIARSSVLAFASPTRGCHLSPCSVPEALRIGHVRHCVHRSMGRSIPQTGDGRKKTPRYIQLKAVVPSHPGFHRAAPIPTFPKKARPWQLSMALPAMTPFSARQVMTIFKVMPVMTVSWGATVLLIAQFIGPALAR